MKDKRAVMSACEYAIESLQAIKKNMMDISLPHHDTHWAIGSLYMVLTANLISIAKEVIADAMADGSSPNAANDIRAIQAQFNKFIDQMIANN